MRTITRAVRTSIAATVLAISVVVVAHAAPPDCMSKRLDASQLPICFPGLFDPGKQPRPPFDSAGLIRTLSNAYSYYIDVKQCHEAKLAFGLFASDLEVERLRNLLKRIEQLVKPELDSAALEVFWASVEVTKRNREVAAIGEWRNSSGGAPVSCRWQRYYGPDRGRIEKDF